jgi:uncharacterized protein (DUF1778 family)
MPTMATTKKKRGAPQKSEKKDQMLRIRVTEEQKALFESAALYSGQTVSSWIVSLCLREARRIKGD